MKNPRDDARRERKNGRRSGRHEGNGARIPGGHAALEPLDMNMVTRANTILFRRPKELAKVSRRRAAPRWSAPKQLNGCSF